MEEWSNFASGILNFKYPFPEEIDVHPQKTWENIARRVVNSVVPPEYKKLRKELFWVISQRKFIPGGRYLYAAGRPYHQVNNCFPYRADDSREGWADLLRKGSMSLMSGGGIGVEYSNVRPEGSTIHKTGGTSSGPLSLVHMVNEVGRFIRQGGSRRAAIWAGLNWNHPDIWKFIKAKDWPPYIVAQKTKDFNTHAPLDMTNISVGLDRDFFDSKSIPNIYYDTCYQMFSKSEPGFSVNYDDPTNNLRNACTEITSSDDSDCCNLGSINFARIESLGELRHVVDIAIKFLLLGSIYSDLPHKEVEVVRDKNRRIGLGIMGIHEWLVKRGLKYDYCEELNPWLTSYSWHSRLSAKTFSNTLDIANPISVNAIAPNGTTGIIGETTTGIEPIYSKSFKRRYVQDDKWVYEYVVDPTARRLINLLGCKEESIEDAYALSQTLDGFESRLRLQAQVQSFVDQGISSTVNIEKWGGATNNEDNWKERADILFDYLPRLRGITCYADGSRGGQPLTPVKMSTALSHEGNVFEEQVDICSITGGGSCS